MESYLNMKDFHNLYNQKTQKNYEESINIQSKSCFWGSSPKEVSREVSFEKESPILKNEI